MAYDRLVSDVNMHKTMGSTMLPILSVRPRLFLALEKAGYSMRTVHYFPTDKPKSVCARIELFDTRAREVVKEWEVYAGDTELARTIAAEVSLLLTARGA